MKRENNRDIRIVSKWDCLVVVAMVLLIVAALLVVFLPRASAETCQVSADGKIKYTYSLQEMYNPVCVIRGVMVRVSNGQVEVEYNTSVARLHAKGESVAFATLGVVVQLV